MGKFTGLKLGLPALALTLGLASDGEESTEVESGKPVIVAKAPEASDVIASGDDPVKKLVEGVSGDARIMIKSWEESDEGEVDEVDGDGDDADSDEPDGEKQPKAAESSKPIIGGGPETDREVSFDKVKSLTLRFSSTDIPKRYKDLEAYNARIGRPKKLVMYDAVEGDFMVENNYFWFVENASEPYKSMAERITEDYGAEDAKLRAIGVWMQNNFEYLKAAKNGPAGRIALEDLGNKGGVCRNGVIVFKQLAESIGLGDDVAAAIFGPDKNSPGHIAPVLRGKHGQISYPLAGEQWTLFETAMVDGSFAPAGSGTSKPPIAFLKADGTIVSANSNMKPVKIVQSTEISPNLLADFHAQLKELDKSLNDKWNKPSERSLQIGIAVAYELEPKLAALRGTFLEMLKTGVVSEDVLEKFQGAGQRSVDLLKAWEKSEAVKKNAYRIETK